MSTADYITALIESNPAPASGLSIFRVRRRPRIFLVMVRRGEDEGPRTLQRWLVDDFRMGTFRRRRDAVRAARRAGMEAR